MRIVLVLAVVIMAGFAGWWFVASTGGAQHCPLDESRTAPSGRAVSLCDVLYEVQPDGSYWAVLRAVDPGLETNGGQEDHDWMCETWGLAALEKEPRPVRIVVQIMSEPFERGEPTPGITQSIEVYSEAEGACQWELL